MSTSTSSATAPSSSSTAEAARPAVHDGVTWVMWLLVLNILFQRVSLPNLSVPVTVPITLGWTLLAWLKGVLALEQRRFVLWLVASAATAAVVLPQVLFVERPYVSVNSWAFWMVMWLPVAFIMSERSTFSYRRMLRGVVTVGLWLSTLSVIFILVQLVGVPYRDYLYEVILPTSLHMQDFATSYPIIYGADLWKSNGWIMLEPSFISFTLGLALMAGLLARVKPWKVLWLLLGMLTTVAGSGFAIVILGGLIMLVRGQTALLRPYILPSAVLTLVAIPTAIGQVMLERVTEVSDSNSSAALRSIEPYLYLIPRWIEDPAKVFFGAGAGASRQAVEASGTMGLIAPTVGKMFFEYGLFAGALLLALAVVPFLRAHEPALALGILAQFFLLQPPSQPLIVPAFILVTLWAPAPWSSRPAGSRGDLTDREGRLPPPATTAAD